ncbi:MAG: hypothetical protein K8R88_03835, partial [Armatimonadetes bacterium]|nr:hypothetical protein [Armatimonadota bacterium]
MKVCRPFLLISMILVLAITALAIAGCGGGGAAGGGGGGGGTSRAAILAELQTKFATFDGTNPDAENQQMLDLMRANSQFEEAGLSDAGGVWGRFTDGTTLVIGNNIGPSTEVPPPLARTNQRTRSYGLPTSENVMVGTAVGSVFENGNAEIADMFRTQTYAVVEDLPTVDALKSFNKLGVLYLTTHGCNTPIVRGGPQVFVAWTATKWVATPAGVPDRYAADLRDGSLTYYMARTYEDAGDTPIVRVETHYGFTSKFVAKYWTGKFNENSFVYMNACSSASLNAFEFEFACLQAGASAYVGWTNTMVIADGLTSGAYLFDRMLGGNAFDAESPPQRAFAYPAILAEMATHKRTNKPTMYDETINPKTNLTAKLQMLTLNLAFGQLAPSIEVLTVDEQKDELTISGVFGDVKGDVLMNNHPMTIKTWTANQIVCTLPRTGNDASGDVQVIAALPRQFSNILQLTEWNGNLTCTFDGSGSLRQVMEFAVHFRADVHDRRIQPHEAPFRIGSNYLQALDTTGTYTTSGTYTSPDGLVTETWMGSGPIPSYIRPPEGTSPPE